MCIRDRDGHGHIAPCKGSGCVGPPGTVLGVRVFLQGDELPEGTNGRRGSQGDLEVLVIKILLVAEQAGHTGTGGQAEYG